MVTSKNHSELADLIQATRTGDEKAFTRLVRRYQHLAHACACSLLNDFDLAQDAVQESFLIVYYQLHKLERTEAFPAWLYSV